MRRIPLWTSVALNSYGNRSMILRTRDWPVGVKKDGVWVAMPKAPVVEGFMEKTKVPKDRWLR